MKKIFKNRLYMASLTADMISNFGDILFYLALMNYVLLLPDARYAIALITVLENIPNITGMFTGYFADKTKDKMKMLISTLVFRVFAYLGVGFIIGFDPALWVVVAIAFINLLSDFAGQYENGLYVPISMKVVSDEDRQEFMAFRQTVSGVLIIVFQAISASLVVFLSYRTIALVNALTFLVATCIMLMIYKPLNKLIQEDKFIKDTEATEEIEQKEKLPFWQDFKNKAVLSYKELKSHKDIFLVLTIVPFFNGIFGIIGAMLIFTISENSNFVIINSATTIAALSISTTVASIVGSFLGMNLLKNLDMIKGLTITSFFGIGLFTGFYLQNIYLVLVCISMSVIISSVISPKLSSQIMNNMDKENLSLIFGFLGSYLQTGILVMNLTFSALVLFMGAKSIALLFLISSISLTIYALYSSRKI
ncbi:MAG: MFS transporter [Gemella sp.]|nr:MFS transporter [Gemella sp.]